MPSKIEQAGRRFLDHALVHEPIPDPWWDPRRSLELLALTGTLRGGRIEPFEPRNQATWVRYTGGEIFRDRHPVSPIVLWPSNVPVQRRAAQRTVRCNRLSAARAPVVHGDRAVAERLRRNKLELSCAGQPALVQSRAVASDPGVDEELVLVD